MVLIRWIFQWLANLKRMWMYCICEFFQCSWVWSFWNLFKGHYVKSITQFHVFVWWILYGSHAIFFYWFMSLMAAVVVLGVLLFFVALSLIGQLDYTFSSNTFLWINFKQHHVYSCFIVDTLLFSFVGIVTSKNLG